MSFSSSTPTLYPSPQGGGRTCTPSHIFHAWRGEDVLAQRLEGDHSLIGVMLESHLFEGCQALGNDLRYGVSVTDGCLGWEATEQLLRDAASQLQQQRRALLAAS